MAKISRSLLIAMCLLPISLMAWGRAPVKGPVKINEVKDVKQVRFTAKELSALDKRKKMVLQELERGLLKANHYKKKDAKFRDSLRRYQAIAMRYGKLKRQIELIKDPDELESVLLACELHDCADLDEALSLERTKNDLTKKLEELNLKLSQLKKTKSLAWDRKDSKTISFISKKISTTQKSLKKRSKPFRNVWLEKRSEIRDFSQRLLRINNLPANEAGSDLIDVMSLINMLEMLTGSDQSMYSFVTAASTTLNAYVLYIHWSDNPEEISNRSELDEGLRQIQESVRQMSYGLVEINFTVCEAEGGAYPNEGWPGDYQEAIRLCDPQLDYVDDEGQSPPFIIFYPLHGGGKTHNNARFDSDDGEFRTSTSKPSWGAFGVNVMTHEIGHAAFDLHHAHSVECDSFVYGGFSCRQGDDYGNFFDSMGYNVGHFNAKYKEKLGWIEPTAYSSSQETYLLRPFETAGFGIVSLKLPISNTLTNGVFEDYRVNEPCDDLYIEYRCPIAGDEDQDFFDPYIEMGLVDPEGGLALICGTTEPPETHYRSDGSAFTGGGTHSWLLDCSPGSRVTRLGDVKDSLIRPGQRCDLTRLGYVVTLVDVTSDNRASVRIQRSCDVGSSTTEECDDIDNDCDGTIDEGCNDDGDWYCDATMTVFGNPNTCSRGGGDCDDENYRIHPNSEESYCDRHDNNCNGLVDEGGVCPEICDDIDNDEDGQTDEGCNDDGDDYCDISMATDEGHHLICPGGGADCNDNDAAINPGAPELCDGIDNNCRGISGGGWVDEGGVCAPPTCTDNDDGYRPTDGGGIVTTTSGPSPVTETLNDSCDEGGRILTEYVCMPLLTGGSRGYAALVSCPSLGLECINPGGGLPAYCGE